MIRTKTRTTPWWATWTVAVSAIVATAGMSEATSDGRQDAATAVDTVFAEYASGASPGCAVGVVQRGKVMLAKAYGLANLEHKVPLTADSSFYMASVSKQFMAMAILLLEREGKLSVDDGVRKYIPELPAWADDITLRHLLHHTSGVRDYLTLGGLAGYSSDHVWTERAALRMIARQRHLNFPVGTEHLYSNSGYVLLSMVAQRAAGRTLDEWAREQLFTPLGMASTRFQHDHARLIPLRASGYVRQAAPSAPGDPRAADDQARWRIGNSMLDVVGDGGMYSTLNDMLRWAVNFDDGKYAPELLARMQTPGTLKDGTAIRNGYGMGFVRGEYRGLQTIGHGGGLVGYRTMVLRMPAQQTTVVCLCNASTANAGRLAQLVAEHYLGDSMSKPAAPTNPGPAANPPAAGTPVPSELRKALTGTFFSEELGTVYVVREEGERLVVDVSDRPPVELSAEGPERLRLARGGPVIVPERDASGRIQSFTLEAGRVRRLLFTRR